LPPCIELPVANVCSNPEHPDPFTRLAGSICSTIFIEVVQSFNIPSIGILSRGFLTSPKDKECSKKPLRLREAATAKPGPARPHLADLQVKTWISTGNDSTADGYFQHSRPVACRPQTPMVRWEPFTNTDHR
jgi:hypothetical protein